MINSSEIKKAALNKLNLKKSFLVSTIFVLANLALSYALTYLTTVTTNTPILNMAVNIIYIVLFVPLSFGFVSAISKLYKSERITGTTIFNDAVLNFSKTIKIFLLTIWKMILPSIIIIIAALGILFLTMQNLPITQENLSGYSIFIFLLYFVVFIGIALAALPYILSSYILVDNKDLNSKEILDRSNSLMENKKWNFVKLIISFLGWFIVLAVIEVIADRLAGEAIGEIVNSIGLILLMPYLITSIRVFYEECEDINE